MTRRSYVRALTVAVLGTAVSFVPSAIVPAMNAAVAMTNLQVLVLSPAGRPVDRASVIITFVEGREPMKLYKKHVLHWELKTNQQGIAKIPPIPQGQIRVQVIAQNYQTSGKTYPVMETEKTITVQLNDPQQQYSAHGDNDPTKPKEAK